MPEQDREQLVERLRQREAMATPAPWQVQDGNSHRRIGVPGKDGNVLRPSRYSDREPHVLTLDGERIYADLMLIVEMRNALPAILSILPPTTSAGDGELDICPNCDGSGESVADTVCTRCNGRGSVPGAASGDGELVKRLRKAGRFDRACNSSNSATVTGSVVVSLYDEAADHIEALTAKLRMIVSHATGGATTDTSLSVNEMAVEITRHVNRVWDQARQEPTARVKDLEEGGKAAVAGWEALPGPRHYSQLEVQEWLVGPMADGIKTLRSALNPSPTEQEKAIG